MTNFFAMKDADIALNSNDVSLSTRFNSTTSYISNEEDSEIKTNSPTLLDWLDLDPPFENCTKPRSPIESGFTSNGVYL